MNGSTERSHSFMYKPPYYFIGTKPSAVMFGEERVDVKTWREVAGAILSQCNGERHDELMYLRNKVAGKVRRIFADSPNGMRRPLRIADDMYMESHYGSETMMYILKDLILKHTGFDCSNIQIVLRRK